MIAADVVYPYRLEPQEKPAIWGGDALVRRYGKSAPPGAAIGESWECWDGNLVANGALSGRTLAELRTELGASLMGPLDPRRPFPVLTKIIDAREPLSVQVHPDDAYAQRVEHQPNGKTECWFILAAAPGAELVLGWARDTDREEYERRVADGSLGDLLRRVPVAAGQAFYLPAGTLHAIGAGIELFETQQASDLTYRIFDWNRLGPDGRGRELHVAKAADVLDFHASTRGALHTLEWRADDVERELLVADHRFCVERVRVGAGGATFATDGVPLTITALGAALDLGAGDARTAVAAYATVVIPAAAARVTCGGPGELLLVRPRPRLDELRTQAARAGLAPEAISAFFEQFG